MSVKIDNEDINTVFEDLLLAEDKANKIGFEEGYCVGENQPVKGYHLGYHRASIIASQLGYYSSVIEYCLRNQYLFAPKVLKQVKELDDHIGKFPSINDGVANIFQIFDNIRFKFTKLSSIAKISISYREAEKLDF